MVACVLTGPLEHSPEKELRTFGTTTDELNALGDWLMEMGCSHIAIENSEIYWKLMLNALESFDIELLLANAYHINNLSGRRMDSQTSEVRFGWLT